MVFKFVACLVRACFFENTNSKNSSKISINLCSVFFIGPFSAVYIVHSWTASRTIFGITGCFRNRRLLESRNKHPEVGYWKVFTLRNMVNFIRIQSEATLKVNEEKSALKIIAIVRHVTGMVRIT
jgi:hypothetical protein